MRIIFLMTFLLLSLAPNFSRAALVNCGPGVPGNPDCDFCDLFGLVNSIFGQIFTWVVPGIATVMLMVGGVLFFMSGSKPDMINKAKGVIIATIIGMVVIFAAWVILNYIFSNIGLVDMPSGWKWYDIRCETP